MPDIMEIASLDDARVEAFAKLTDAQLRAQYESGEGLFIAEGVQVSSIALDAGCWPVAMLCARRHVEGKARALAERLGACPVYVADDETLAQLTGYPLTRGVLCAFRRPAARDAADVLAGARRVAVLEGLNDGANVGALFRSAAALGMDAMLLLPTCRDPLSRRTLRVSMGTVLQLPWARVDSVETLRAHGFTTVALALRDDSISIDDPRLKAADRLALVLGAEGSGLAPETISACDHAVRIPMHNGVDSLNVAAAGAVAFWEAGKSV